MRRFTDFFAAYKAWDGKGPRPPEVTQHAESARSRARKAWLRSHPDDAVGARDAGRRSWQGVIVGWARFIKGAKAPE